MVMHRASQSGKSEIGGFFHDQVPTTTYYKYTSVVESTLQVSYTKESELNESP